MQLEVLELDSAGDRDIAGAGFLGTEVTTTRVPMLPVVEAGVATKLLAVLAVDGSATLNTERVAFVAWTEATTRAP